MKTEAQNRLVELLLPKEKGWDEKGLTTHDKLIHLGWNMYREKLLEVFNHKEIKE